jgi:hypothetical protein
MESLDTEAAAARLATTSWASRGYQQMSRDVDQLPERLREIRLDRFGEHGIPRLSETMKIPAGTWENFEAGVQVPGWALLEFIEICGVDPHWLLTGEGERYRVRSEVLHERSGT